MSPGSVPAWGTDIPQTIQLGHQFSYKESLQGFPLWFSGLESICQGVGHGLDPWCRKIPHATGRLSLCAAATDLLPRAHALQQKKSQQ